MAIEVILPKWGLTMEEGMVSEWRKQEGDAVAEDEIIADVETDKITNELPAPGDRHPCQDPGRGWRDGRSRHGAGVDRRDAGRGSGNCRAA